MSVKRLGVLISGRGSNLAAILAAQENNTLTQGQVSVVISNKASAGGLEIAQSAGIPTAVVKIKDADGNRKHLESFDQEVVALLKAHDVDAVVLAGYGRILSDVLLSAFPNRIINIHPSLLPDFGGVGMLGHAVHEAVVNAKASHSGCTVHLVTETVDGGPILGRSEVPVFSTDTPELLAARVLEQEHRLYPAVLEQWLPDLTSPTLYVNWQTAPETVVS